MQGQYRICSLTALSSLGQSVPSDPTSGSSYATGNVYRAVNFWELLCVRTKKILFAPSNCAVLTFKKKWQAKKQNTTNKKRTTKKFSHFSSLTSTSVHRFVWGRFYLLYSFHEKKVRDAGDFICLAGEREKSVQAGDSISMQESWQPCVCIS